MDARTFLSALDDNFCPQFNFGVEFEDDFGDGDDAIIPTVAVEDVRPPPPPPPTVDNFCFVDFGDDDFGDDAIVPTVENVRASPPPPPTVSPAHEVDLDEEIHQFVVNQKAKSTTYKDTTCTNRLHSFMKEINPTEGRQFWELNRMELDKIICLFYMRAKKTNQNSIKNGGCDLYQPDTLNCFRNAWQRVLKTKKIDFNLKTDPGFERSREVLKSRRKELTKLGLGNKPNATRSLERDEVDQLYNDGHFGTHNALVLARTMWWKVSLLFGYRGRDESSKMLLGDIRLCKDKDGREYLEWGTERGSKTRTGEHTGPKNQRAFSGKAYEFNSDRCPVKIFKEFVRRRPTAAEGPKSRFFLQTIPVDRLKGDVWYYPSGMGKNKLGSMMKGAAELLERINSSDSSSISNTVNGTKISNHCVRKTTITSLLDNEVHPIHVCQVTGHKNSESLKHYHVASTKKRREMSNILNDNDHASSRLVPSSVTPSRPSVVSSVSLEPSVNLPVQSPVQSFPMPMSSSGIVSSSNEQRSAGILQGFSSNSAIANNNNNNTNNTMDQNLDSIFRGAIMNNCTFNLQFYAAQQPPHPERKRRRISSSSDDDA